MVLALLFWGRAVALGIMASRVLHGDRFRAHDPQVKEYLRVVKTQAAESTCRLAERQLCEDENSSSKLAIA
jgi:hypothetical protein